jgi:flagellar L-ring protein precursor FlgH
MNNDRVNKVWKLRCGLLLLLVTGLLQEALADSLFSEDNYFSLVADKRALRVGDALTVIIIESSEAVSASDRSLDRSYNISADIGVGNDDESGGVDFGVDREAGTVTQREGTLKAAITLEVTEIDPSGNLVVEGEQRIAVDGKEQLMSVSGRIRPVDVSNDNTVLSSRLINARILYSGYDVTEDGKKRNVLYRFLSGLGVI